MYSDIRGIRMYYEIYGNGEPVLFIHGNGGSIASFTYQIPYFEKNYKVIIGDNRSQGRSKDDGDSLTFEMMADDYAALLDKLNLDSVNVVGWSDGGVIAILLALRHPEKVKKMAFTGANLQPDSSAIFSDVLDIVLPGYERLKMLQNRTSSQARSFKLV